MAAAAAAAKRVHKLLPFDLRFGLLHKIISQLEETGALPAELAIEMMSVLCPICPARDQCNAPLKEAEEEATIFSGERSEALA